MYCFFYQSQMQELKQSLTSNTGTSPAIPAYAAAMVRSSRHRTSPIVSLLLMVTLLAFPLSQIGWGGLLLCIESDGIAHVETLETADCFPVLPITQHRAHQGEHTAFLGHVNQEVPCFDIPLVLSIVETRVSTPAVHVSLPTVFQTTYVSLPEPTPSLPRSEVSKYLPSSLSLTTLQTVVLRI